MTRWFKNRQPLVVTEHAYTREVYPSSRIADRVMRSLIGRFYHRADGVVTVSQGVGDGLLEFGVRSDQIHVVHNAIELAEIQSQARQAPPDFPAAGIPTVITVGRHARIKDHETLIRAFALTRGRVRARLLLVGQGPLRKRLEALVHELDLADSVVFAGWQDNPFAWMARSDLFVLSSRFEGFGNVIVEAMACGLPVISTDCRSGPREILRDGQDGVLVPSGNVDALAAAMTNLLSDGESRAEFARRSRRRAADFDIALIGVKYEALLQSLVQRQAAAVAES
jgi:glycosyltransferase involved in cell wall biosynthesis